jgi:hypothetical protein
MSLCISDWIGNVDDIDTVYWSYMDGTERLGIVYGVCYNGQNASTWNTPGFMS